MVFKARFAILGILISSLLLILPARPAPAQVQVVMPILQRFWIYLATFAGEYCLEKAVDYYLLEGIQEQLGEYLPFLKAEAEKAPKEEHERLVGQVLEAENLLAIYGKFAAGTYTREEARQLQAELRDRSGELSSLQQRTGDLERRNDRLESKVDAQTRRLDEVERRLDAADEVRQKDCRDMSGPGVSLVGGYFVQLAENSVRRSTEDFEGLHTRATIYLNACSGDRTTRGILMVLQTVTRHLSREVEVVVTFKDLQQGRGNIARFGQLSQEHIPLFRPGPGTEGRITEIFLPHYSLPTSGNYPALGLGMTVLHDGELLFATQAGLRCWSGELIQCSWI